MSESPGFIYPTPDQYLDFIFMQEGVRITGNECDVELFFGPLEDYDAQKFQAGLQEIIQKIYFGAIHYARGIPGFTEELDHLARSRGTFMQTVPIHFPWSAHINWLYSLTTGETEPLKRDGQREKKEFLYSLYERGIQEGEPEHRASQVAGDINQAIEDALKVLTHESYDSHLH